MTKPVTDADPKVIVKKRSWLRKSVCIFLLLYLFSYSILSMNGGYVDAASGKMRMSYGFAIPDMLVWQPYYGEGFWSKRNGGEYIWNADIVGFFKLRS